MDAAFQTINNGNILQIDSLYKNYVCTQKGRVRITFANEDVDPNPAYPEGIVYAYGAVNPLIAINCPRHIRTWRENISGGFRFRFSVDDWFHVQQGQDFMMEYYVFDSPISPSAHGVGMQIYSPTELVFDSNLEYMKILGVIADNASFPLTGQVERNYRFGNGPVAVITCQQAMKTLNTDIWIGGSEGTVPGIEFYSLTARVSGPTITTMDWMVYSIIGSAVAFINRPQNFMLVVDLEGMKVP